nr:MAG TPA: hypothetical protein [Caudoviricetes sp.]
MILPLLILTCETPIISIYKPFERKTKRTFWAINSENPNLARITRQKRKTKQTFFYISSKSPRIC